MAAERVFNIHVGEISLKGKNRRVFEQRLIDNIRIATGCRNIKSAMGRLILFPGSNGNERIVDGLKRTFGIEWFSESLRTGNSIGEITDTITGNAGGMKKRKIKLDTKRADKKYPLTSMEISKKVGMELERSGFEVDLENPEEWIFIEVVKNAAIISFGKTRGLGGLPVGSSGKVLSLLSGGIDSPVSSWLMMKRGCTVDMLHLHAFPTNDKARKSKIIRLVEKLKEYHPLKMRLFLVPYGAFYEKSFEMEARSELVVFRRFVLRLANRIAEKNGHLGFVTGDSVGQVASQTLENLYATSAVSEYPIYRPLVGHDKKEIIALAEKIGTYGISIEEYKDCCSLVAERHPSTKVKAEQAKKEEEKIGIDKIVDEALRKMEIVEF
ncbi:tRNA 4-thiouridine(8) synthase ThiI [Candidatus Micrarchaeota archaeon]|nr:tRNA 4-thiouridine(8) synthase ThiI [Candidatus Micrarchaeota archaeon]